MLSGGKACQSCRSRQELSKEYLLAKFGVDTAEDDPLKVCQKLAKSQNKSQKNIGHPPDALPFSQEIAYQDFALFFEAEATAREIMDTIDKISSEEQDLRRRKMMKAIPIADLHNKQSIATLARHICEAAKNSTNSSTLR